MTDTVVGRVLAAMPADATELRIMQHRVTKSVGTGVSEWIGNELFGGSDAPSDAPRPLRTAELHWYGTGGQPTVVKLAEDEGLTSDDFAGLLAVARDRGAGVAVWTQSDSRVDSSMRLSAMWFRSDAPAGEHRVVSSQVDGATTRVTVDEREPPRRWWLIFYPVLIVSFAWVFFLVMGGLGKIIRDVWQRATGGVQQHWVATLAADALTIEVTTDGVPTEPIEIDRCALVALGAHFGLSAYTTRGAVSLPSAWVSHRRQSDPSISADVAYRLNRALGVQ